MNANNDLETLKNKINPFKEYAVLLDKLSLNISNELTPGDAFILRWNGLYLQRPAEKQLYMLRLKLPDGLVSLNQLKAIYDILQLTGSDFLDLTTRQDIELRDIRLSQLKDILILLNSAGITTAGSCGDTVRNIITCPVSGLDNKESIDLTEKVKELSDQFTGKPEYNSLPRKFKIAICGCKNNCVPLEVNDIGLKAANYNRQPGFILFIGGGLSTKPVLASNTNIWIPENETIEVVTAILELFNKYGNRNNRNKARLKYLIADIGLNKLIELLEIRLNRILIKTNLYINERKHTGIDHAGIHKQNNPELFYAGIPVLAGRLHLTQLKILIDITEKIKSNKLRVTHLQNLILSDIPESELKNVISQLKIAGLAPDKGYWSARTIVCTGKEHCNKALVVTKSRFGEIIKQLDQYLEPEKINIAVSGCPNGCGRHSIADIGFQGVITKTDKVIEERFNLYLGGQTGVGQARLSKCIARQIHPDEILNKIIDLVDLYRLSKHPEENFSDYLNRKISDQSK